MKTFFKTVVVLLLVVFATFLTGCNGGDDDHEPDQEAEETAVESGPNIFSYVQYYSWDETPDLTCRSEAVAKALWAEDFGYNGVRIVYGQHNEVNHVEVRIKDMMGFDKWITRNGNYVDLVDSIDGWVPSRLAWDLDEFIVRCRAWAEQNNFYRIDD